jgi:hypothetical protein
VLVLAILTVVNGKSFISHYWNALCNILSVIAVGYESVTVFRNGFNNTQMPWWWVLFFEATAYLTRV